MGGRPSGVFRCGACIYRCVLNGAQVAVKMSSIGQISRGAPRLTQAPPAVLKKLEAVRSLSHRNVFRLAAARPRHGVLAYEWSYGGSLRDKRLSGGDMLKALVHVAWGFVVGQVNVAKLANDAKEVES